MWMTSWSLAFQVHFSALLFAVQRPTSFRETRVVLGRAGRSYTTPADSQSRQQRHHVATDRNTMTGFMKQRSYRVRDWSHESTRTEFHDQRQTAPMRSGNNASCTRARSPCSGCKHFVGPTHMHTPSRQSWWRQSSTSKWLLYSIKLKWLAQQNEANRSNEQSSAQTKNTNWCKHCNNHHDVNMGFKARTSDSHIMWRHDTMCAPYSRLN